MYVHFDARVALVTPPKIASRQQANTARDRDFQVVGNHHEGPHNMNSRATDTAERLWWEMDQSEFSYVTTVRNHFDILLTWFQGYQRITKPRPEKVNVDFLETWPFGQPKFFTSKRRLFRFIWELPDPLIMRYETIRADFDAMLQRFGLPALEPWEFPHLPADKTSGKPRDGYHNHWEPDARAWVEDHMGEEMERLGYRWDA